MIIMLFTMRLLALKREILAVSLYTRGFLIVQLFILNANKIPVVMTKCCIVQSPKGLLQSLSPVFRLITL